MWVLYEELPGAPAFSSPESFPAGFCSQFWGPNHPGTGILGWGPGMGLGLLAPKILLQNFYPPHVRDQPVLHLYPSYLSGWMWFL